MSIIDEVRRNLDRRDNLDPELLAALPRMMVTIIEQATVHALEHRGIGIGTAGEYRALGLDEMHALGRDIGANAAQVLALELEAEL